MLKRHQILLEDWMVKYLRFLSELHDGSFSEVVRITLCIEFLDTINRICPEYQIKLSKNEILKRFSKSRKDATNQEEGHKLLSKLYFEARKATEYRMNKHKSA